MALSMFRVYKTAAQTGCLNLAYTKVSWQGEFLNEGSYFDVANGVYRPPTGSKILLNSSIWAQANCKSPNNSPYEAYSFNAKIIKNGGVADPNGTKDMTTIGWEPAGYTNTAGSMVSGFVDIVAEGDYYELWVYCTSANGANDVALDSNPAHSWWTGVCFT